MPKKIACCVDAWFPLQGGVQHHVAEVYKELLCQESSREYEWCVLTRAIRGTELSPVPVLRFGWATAFENPLMRFYYVFRLFIHLLWKGRFYQLYHAQDASSAVAIKLAAIFTRVPTVLTVHGTTLFSSSKGFVGRSKKILEKMIFLKFRYDALLSVSSNLLEAKGLRTPVSLLRNGVKMESFPARPWGKRQGPLRLLFVGRLEEVKGLSILFGAMENLGDTVQLCVVGDGSLRKSLEKKALAKGLPVVFLGPLDGQELAKAYGASEVFVLPSLSEGFPLSLLEASATGLAVVATCVGDVSVLVHPGKNGLLVSPDDVDSLTEALRSLVEDRSLVERMGKYAHDVVAPTFSWKQTVELIKKGYEQALWAESPRFMSCLRSVLEDPRMTWRLARIFRERRSFEKMDNGREPLLFSFTVDVEHEGGSGLRRTALEAKRHIPRFFREFSEKLGPLDIPTTLFVQGELLPDFREEFLTLQRSGHELGVHGYAHELWGQETWFLKDRWQNPAYRFFHLSAIRDELQAAGLENVFAFRAPNMVSDLATKKLLSRFGFSLDSSGATQLGEEPVPWFVRDPGYLSGQFSLPVSRDPKPSIKWVRGLPFGHYNVMNMAHLIRWTDDEFLEAVKRLRGFHHVHGVRPHLVFLVHSWDVLPHWDALIKKIQFLRSRMPIEFLTMSDLRKKLISKS